MKVSADYRFISAGGEAVPRRTLLIMQASRSKAVMAKVVVGKGRVDPGSVGWSIDQIKRPAVGRCILQADGEPAQRAFVKDVIEEVCPHRWWCAGAHGRA